jgi:sodium transport system permease protein
MRWNFIARVTGKEILSTLRDRRTLVTSILLPLIIIPLFLIGFPLIIGNTFQRERQERRQTVGVVGLQNVPAALKKLLETDQPGATGVNLIEVQDATKAAQDGAVEAAIVVPKLPSSAGGKPVPIEVHYKESSQRAQLIFSKLENAIQAYSGQLVQAKLSEFKLPPQTLTPVIAAPVNADNAAERASGVFAFLIPMFIMQWILIGGQATAIDATAGEKERGTLEALLVTPISRLEVVVGKLLAVVGFSVMSTVFSMIGLVLTGLIAAVVLPSQLSKSANSDRLATAFGGNLSLSPDGFLQLLIVSLTVAVMVGALLLAICIFARSFKEAQTYIAPLSILIVIPAVFLQFADFVSRGTGLYSIPLVGSMLVILDVVKGVLNWSHAGTAIIVNLVVAGVAVALALRNFSREQVLFRN